MGLIVEGKVTGFSKNQKSGGTTTTVLTFDESDIVRAYDPNGRAFRVGDRVRLAVRIGNQKPFDGFCFLSDEQPEGFGAVGSPAAAFKKAV